MGSKMKLRNLGERIGLAPEPLIAEGEKGALLAGVYTAGQRERVRLRLGTESLSEIPCPSWLHRGRVPRLPIPSTGLQTRRRHSCHGQLSPPAHCRAPLAPR